MNPPSPTKPRVGIYCLDQDARRTPSLGILNYTRQLLAAFARAPEPDLDIVAFLSEDNAPVFDPGKRPAWMHTHVTRGCFGHGMKRLVADHLLSVRLARREKVDLLHYPKGFLPLAPLKGIRSVATVHDAIYAHYREHYPHAMTGVRPRYFLRMITRALRKATHVITPSDYSRSCLVALHPPVEKRITVIGEGPALPPASGDFDGPIDFVIMGSRMPHKATREALLLLEGYARMKNRRYDVLVAGLAAWPAAWGQSPTQNRLHWPGRLPDQALANAIHAGKALIFLSTIEGFGIPLLDAYALDTPVCYRNDTSLREVMDGIPGAWDGRSSETFCKALDQATSLSPGDIREHRARLFERYNWDTAARDTLALYGRLLRSPSP